MAATNPMAGARKAVGRDHFDRESISLVAQPGNFCSNPLTVLKHENTDCADVCFIKPLRSKVSLCLIECEVTSCEFPTQHLLGCLSEAASRRELQKFPVAEGPIVFVERVSAW